MLINVAYAIPPDSRKADLWHDGFTAAIGVIARDHDVRWLNLHPDAAGQQGSLDLLDSCDFLLVKSNWRWMVDALVRRYSRRARRGLVISGTAKPPWRRAQRFYDTLYYETEWYEPQIRHHPRRIHAFGIDTSIMHPGPIDDRDIDLFSVGGLLPYKRHERLLGRAGRRVIASDLSGGDQALHAALVADGVTVLDFLPQPEVADLYRRASRVVVSCTIDGGGERAVLEARACACEVEVAEDNPKLREMLEAPVWDHHYYAAQILSGID